MILRELSDTPGFIIRYNLNLRSADETVLIADSGEKLKKHLRQGSKGK